MALRKWNGGACEKETSHPSGLCSDHRPTAQVKADKKTATTSALIDRWREDFFTALADCDDIVPRNTIVSLQAKHPYAGVRAGMRYRELFGHMEGVE